MIILHRNAGDHFAYKVLPTLSGIIWRPYCEHASTELRAIIYYHIICKGKFLLVLILLLHICLLGHTYLPMARSVDILSNAQIEKLTQNELQKYATNITHAYKHLYDTLSNEETGGIPRLEGQLAIATNSNKLLMKK